MGSNVSRTPPGNPRQLHDRAVIRGAASLFLDLGSPPPVAGSAPMGSMGCQLLPVPSSSRCCGPRIPDTGPSTGTCRMPSSCCCSRGAPSPSPRAAPHSCARGGPTAPTFSRTGPRRGSQGSRSCHYGTRARGQRRMLHCSGPLPRSRCLGAVCLLRRHAPGSRHWRQTSRGSRPWQRRSMGRRWHRLYSTVHESSVFKLVIL